MLRKLIMLSAAFVMATALVACDKSSSGGNTAASQPKPVKTGEYTAPGSELNMDSGKEDPTGTSKKKEGDKTEGK